MHEPTREAAEALAADRERGAAAVSQDALEALARHAEDAPAGDAGELRETTREAARLLAEARPAMRPLATKVAAAWTRILDAVDPGDPVEAARGAAADAVRGLADEAEAAHGEAAAAAAEALEGCEVVATFSRSSTAAAALDQLEAAVVVLESLPGGEGRDVALERAEAGGDVRLLPDAYAAGGLEDQGVEGVVVGADGVTPDGAVVNKVGSRTLAAAAAHLDVPFLAATTTWKCAPGPEPDEEARWDVPEAVAARVPLFEATPPGLVEGVATEWGVLDPAEAGLVAGERAQQLEAIGLEARGNPGPRRASGLLPGNGP